MTTKISKKLVSVNDQIHTSSMIYFDIFYFVPNFFTVKLRLKTQVFQSINNYFYENEELFCNGETFDSAENFSVFPTKN